MPVRVRLVRPHRPRERVGAVHGLRLPGLSGGADTARVFEMRRRSKVPQCERTGRSIYGEVTARAALERRNGKAGALAWAMFWCAGDPGAEAHWHVYNLHDPIKR
jgi:hypothetical protein